MKKPHKVAPAGPSVFREPPASDKRRRHFIGPVKSLKTGEPCYLHGHFPVVPTLRVETDETYCGKRRKGKA